MEVIELRPRMHLIKPVFGQVYVWQDGSQLTMIDSGIPGSQDDLAAAFAELGYRRGDLRRVIVTHGHEDHAGSVAAVREWGDVEVLAHRADSAIVRGERARPEPDLTPAEQPLYDQVAANLPGIPPCQVDTELSDGDVIDFGDGAQVIATPGHTDGSVAIWLPRPGVLFTGDVVANGSAGLMLGPFNTDRRQARESVARLARTPAQVVCFGHGDPLADDAGAAAWRELGVRTRAGAGAVPDPLG
ncbi:MAG TPA: MBL fold metallo-hydrolase [Jatrophihabitantaceae bacterium]|jgi:glyoxylase-like metal-dependent hydrolase (beta-lactamase superfamily II)